MSARNAPVAVLAAALGLGVAASGAAPAAWGRETLIRSAAVVTMDAAHHVLRPGRVLIEADRIAAVWERGARSRRIGDGRLRRARAIDFGPRTLVFPGMINLHDHPTSDMLEPWPAPASHAIPEAGKAGTDPYDNRYEWNTEGPDEFARLVQNPRRAITSPNALDLAGDAIKYAEVEAMLGGETAMQGASFVPEADAVGIRNVESDVFGTGVAQPRVGAIADLAGSELTSLASSLQDGTYDAWIVHLAEGVRDGDRRPGDPVSSRAEFGVLRDKGLLNEATVIVHGLGLERSDFAAMAEAGAKLVWSPRSNLQLYGRTAGAYAALAQGVLVSLGTDWTPSGSASLLGELKVADRALRDRRVLGRDRHLVPALASQRALDRELVDMVTRNPTRTLRWGRYVGSLEAGKRADLFVIRRPEGRRPNGAPANPYRTLIDSHERDVKLVLVDGRATAGGVGRMSRADPDGFEVVPIPGTAYRRAIDITDPATPGGTETFASLSERLRSGLTALGGDEPPVGGGPASASNTYSYLKARWAHGALAHLSDADFRRVLEAFFGVDSAGRLNIEAVQLTPPVDSGNDFLGHLLDGDLDPSTGLIADPTAPFGLYPANLNHIGPRGNPLAGLWTD